MLTFKQWLSRPLTEADLDTTLIFTRPPQQYMIQRLVIQLRGTFTFGVVGAVDYVIGADFLGRFIERLQFQLGSANFLKDTRGDSMMLFTHTHNPCFGAANNVAEGATYTSGDTLDVILTTNIEFTDPNNINGGNSTLIPSLYPDLQLNVQLADFADLVTAGDWDYTFAGRIAVTVEQDTKPLIQPDRLLKEWTQTTRITATGVLEIDLPTSILISEMLVVPLQDGIAKIDAIDVDELLRINVESGTTILDERYIGSIQAMDAQDASLLYPLMYLLADALYVPAARYNFMHFHDGVQWDNRSVKKWTLEIPVVYDALFDRDIYLHFIGQNPIRAKG